MKRKILAQTSAVFDPLPLCLPVTIKGRLLLHDFWKRKLGWDDAISEDLGTRWKVLYQEIVLSNSLESPKQVFSDCSSADLYVFCDASKAANGFAMLCRAIDLWCLKFFFASGSPMWGLKGFYVVSG